MPGCIWQWLYLGQCFVALVIILFSQQQYIFAAAVATLSSSVVQIAAVYKVINW
ncbi:MAG: hypothetical protein RLZZ316_3091 [Bacteroidota bacterium]